MAKAKSTTETTSDNASKKWYQFNWTSIFSVIMGIGTLLAIASIVYSTSVIVLGTEGYIPLIMIAPQATLALVILIKKFAK